MHLLIKSLLSILALLLLFEAMVYAFHLLNEPSNLAVLAGTGLLLVLVLAGIVAFRAIWSRRWG